MKNANFNKIINGKEPASIKLTIKSMHISSITHDHVLFCKDVDINDGIKMDTQVRMSLTRANFAKLHLVTGNRISLKGMVHHNKYCFWIFQPQNIHKIVNNTNLLLRMEKYIIKHDAKAKRNKD